MQKKEPLSVFRQFTSLKRLPVGLGKLVRLRRLELEATLVRYIPTDVEGLTCLRYLDVFMVSRDTQKNETSTLSDLMNLNHLRGKLKIDRLGELKEANDAKKANLHNKKHFRDLCLRFSGIYAHEEKSMRMTVDENVLEALQPHPNLQMLHIWDYSVEDSVPHHIFDTPSLRTFNFVECDTLKERLIQYFPGDTRPSWASNW
ncbi:hypothetical protein ACFE04_008629 [Oxalis oulophora]